MKSEGEISSYKWFDVDYLIHLVEVVISEAAEPLIRLTAFSNSFLCLYVKIALFHNNNCFRKKGLSTRKLGAIQG